MHPTSVCRERERNIDPIEQRKTVRRAMIPLSVLLLIPIGKMFLCFVFVPRL